MRLQLFPLLVLLAIPSAAQEVHIPLNEGWSFCQVGQERWYPAEVPGVVQTDLLRNGLIPDFMQGSNIDSVQWIENEDWIYKRSLYVTDTLLRHGHLDLVFKGLDTFAEVYLNDSLVGKADNMFRTWEWPVKHHFKKGGNELKVIFRSPIKEGAKLREAYGIQLPHDNDPTGVSPYIRKAAYQFGWDFCPRLVTSGIWQGVELRGWSGARVSGVDVQRVPTIGEHGHTKLWAMPVMTIDDNVRPRVVVRLNDSVIGDYIDMTEAHTKHDRSLNDPFVDPQHYAAWWPRGTGRANMHRIRVEVWLKNKLVSSWEDAIGFREVELDRSPYDMGSLFRFVVNDSSVFAKGVNLIPPSIVTGDIHDSTWVGLVERMRDANMNMVRLWAGGIYPPEAFYDACDTAGIMVWQDIMVGNMAPADHAFRQNLSAEVHEVTGRLQHHPCVVLYCGNNELDVAWKNWGWQDRYRLHGPDSVRVGADQAAIFDKVIPQTLRLFTVVPYTPTSPLSNWGNAKGLTEGDLHYWGVWHGDSTFSSFKNNVGRFVSEWGFQSYPDSALMAKYIHPDRLYLGSPAVARLQRSYKTDRPIWEAIERELGEERPTTLGGFIEASQRAQAKAYGMAIEAHLGAQPHCMGTLLWQLNDCWPGPSWSIIDYEGNPKPAYEVVKRLYSTDP